MTAQTQTKQIVLNEISARPIRKRTEVSTALTLAVRLHQRSTFRAITGTTSQDGVCECGGLIEAVPNVVDLAAFLADRVARDARELAAYVRDGAGGHTSGDEKRAPHVPRGSSRHGHPEDSQ